MTYDQAIAYIHSLERFGSKLGLENISTLLQRLGSPHKQLRFVHVAGTNGKGSTSAMLAGVLAAAGFSTGLYISPYVLEFRERMQLNGSMIPPQELAEVVQAVRQQADEMAATGSQPTEFEVVTAAALLWYARRRCDIVVLEVGLGGRFDATNAIETPLVSVITAIGKDHTQLLGDSLEKIAFEKCGIIKPGGTTVSYPAQPPEALAVIMQQAAQRGNSLLMPNLAGVSLHSSSLEGSRFAYRGLELFVPLAGRHQIANCVTALEALFALRAKGLAIPDEAIVAGLASVRFPARLELLGNQPIILLDGAHNPAGAAALADALTLLQGKRIHSIVGMLADKACEHALELVAPRFDRMLTVTPPNPRALPAEELAALAAPYCPRVQPCGSLPQAIELALQGAPDALVVWGSLYLAAEIRPLLLQRQSS